MSSLAELQISLIMQGFWLLGHVTVQARLGTLSCMQPQKKWKASFSWHSQVPFFACILSTLTKDLKHWWRVANSLGSRICNSESPQVLTYYKNKTMVKYATIAAIYIDNKVDAVAVSLGLLFGREG